MPNNSDLAALRAELARMEKEEQHDSEPAAGALASKRRSAELLKDEGSLDTLRAPVEAKNNDRGLQVKNVVDPKDLKTEYEINAIIGPGLERIAAIREENKQIIKEIEARTALDTEIVQEFIRTRLGGDLKRAVRVFEEIKDGYDKDRKKDKKGPLYNSKAVNEYVYDVTVPEIDTVHDEAVRGAWHAGEFKFSEDKLSWNEDIDDDERLFIKYTLAFFAAADAIVNENISRNFLNECDLAEVKAVYATQLHVECIHNEVYGKLLKTYVTDADELSHLFNAVREVQVVKDKAEWAERWISDTNASYGERLVAFACVEGIFFSGSFASIFWLKDRKSAKGNRVLPQLVLSNEWISRDEGLHTRFAVLIHSLLDPEDQASEETIHKIVDSATMLEIAFVTKALSVDLVQGMTCTRMKQCICYTADVLLSQLGVEKLYNVANPFEFMSNIGLPMKSNFFEVKVSDYQKIGKVSKDKGAETKKLFKQVKSTDAGAF